MTPLRLEAHYNCTIDTYKHTLFYIWLSWKLPFEDQKCHSFSNVNNDLRAVLLGVGWFKFSWLLVNLC